MNAIVLPSVPGFVRLATGRPETLREVYGVDATAAKRGWSLPRNMSGSRYHFFDGSTHCLCGRWLESELLNDFEDRRPIICADAKDCVARWQNRFEPTRRTFVRGRVAS